MNRTLWSLCTLGLIVLLVACGGSDVIVPPTEEFGGPEFAAVVVNTDLAVGPERLVFGVVGRDGVPLKAESATVRTYFVDKFRDDSETPESQQTSNGQNASALQQDLAPPQLRQTFTARFQEWHYEKAGVLVANPEFDSAGYWELEAELTTAEGQQVIAKSAFTVKDSSATPAVGASAPASVTLTASDVPDLSHITTASEPDPALYAISIHEALLERKPFVVSFSTPRYCSTGTCGPQVKQLADLLSQYSDTVNIIHVEVYRNPHQFEDGQRPNKDDAVDAVREWGLPTEPWTFVVDSDGIIRAKFEAYTPASVIEDALREVLN